MTDKVKVERDLLRRLLVLAAEDDGDRFFTEADVDLMRSLAPLAGIDPNEVTPGEHLCRVTGKHTMKLRPGPLKESVAAAVAHWSTSAGVTLDPSDRARLTARASDLIPLQSQWFCRRCGKTTGSRPPSVFDIVHKAALGLGFIKGPEGA